MTEWRDSLRLALVDTFVVDGAKQQEVFDAIIEEIAGLRTAYARTPDRPGAEAEEPSNKWPDLTMSTISLARFGGWQLSRPESQALREIKYSEFQEIRTHQNYIKATTLLR
ncbi:hypothetical protein [Rhizobium indicum]|uniref:hypothetical protein n=1 Tax=Rhizobium indicum TaxID=2583231 RepID=UPI001FE3E911|nr:hypothetical protein [Rhizobium indicum]